MKKDTPKDVPACPRGFHWCDKREECIPDGTGAEDKLEKRQQRYFFKEENKIDQLVDEVFAGGFSQFGKQRKVEKKIDRLLDALTQNDDDDEDGMISTSGRPYAAPVQMKVVTTIDGKAELSQECGMNGGPMGGSFEDGEYDEGPAKPDNPQKHSNDINQVPDQDAPALLNSIRRQLSEMKNNDAYKKYFKAALKRYGYNSPADIPADKKKQFFNAVDKGWKASHEK
jgi:hypothetical protein